MPSQTIQWFPGHMAKTRRLIKESLSMVDAVTELLDARIPMSSRNPELDELRSILNGGKDILARIELEEQEKTGIKKLKIGYNRVFGYYIEVSKSFTDQVPEDYIRKQTLVNGERYITPELKEMENTIFKLLEAWQRKRQRDQAR